MNHLKTKFLPIFLIFGLFFFTFSLSEAKRLPSPAYPLPIEITDLSPETFPIETERKFLLHADSLKEMNLSTAKSYQIIQTYLSYEPEIRIRRINNSWHTFALKIPKDSIGLSRSELEFSISKVVYEDLVKKQIGQTIYKTRYQSQYGDYEVFIDVYAGNLEGLLVAEVEFDSIEEADQFKPFSWFGKEVTSDKRYKNAGLAQNGNPDSE